MTVNQPSRHFGPVARARPAATRASASWAISYVVFQFACQLALLIPELGAIRVVVRSAAILGTGALLLFVPGRGPSSTLKRWCYATLVILLLSAINPAGNGLIASLAQIGLYLAILGPIFWVSRLELTPNDFQKLLLLMWLFYSASAGFGVLQTYFPGSFQPPLSTIVRDHGKDAVMSLQIELASGERIFRPMGLTDVPGGAAAGGLYALLLGLGVFQAGHRNPLIRPLAIVSMIVGAICLYVCQIRSLVVMAFVCLVTVIVIQAVSGRISRLLGAVATLFAVLPFALMSALSVGGRVVSDRLSTLTESSVGQVYFSNRGHFLQATIDVLLPKYPLGAGLGRWGMVCRYFGNMANSIWVEIQWTGWLLDGGVPLVFTYTVAIMTVTYGALRMALRRDSGIINTWAAIVVAYNVGALALCFSYAMFIGTTGIEFWLINAAFIQAALHDERTRALALNSA